MSARRPLGPPPGQASQFFAFQKSNQAQPWQNPLNSGLTGDEGANPARFPAQYFNPNPYDDIINLKRNTIVPAAGKTQAVMGQENVFVPGMPVVATMPITDRDFEWAQNKREQMEYAQFRTWLEQQYNLADPAQREMFARLIPDYFAQREALLENMADNALRFAKLRLRGPKDLDDFMFQWLVQTGRIQLPEGNLWDPSAKEGWATKTLEPQYALFNPLRLLGPKNQPNMPLTTNRLDPMGDQKHRMGPKENAAYYGGIPYLSSYRQYSSAGTSASDSHYEAEEGFNPYNTYSAYGRGNQASNQSKSGSSLNPSVPSSS